MAKILIVEDEEAQRLLYETEISEMGHDVVLAADGEAAVQKVRNEKPDLLILDLMMPKVHGLDALRKALSLNPNLPVIIHTAYSHFKDNHLSWAAEAYVVKSSDLTELRNAIKRTLAGQVTSQSIR
ncbi:MAG TPA: response regulator [Calditrichia bacterium]|nr:response regulator [Calditrichota bacterium]HQU71017.1 response regulator [Calditrichia bacterium]HQV30584.1 response regulator [Calditrichia bacterium]